MSTSIDYESSPKWEDVVPIPQNEGGPDPLAAIAYTDEYSQATSYLRAVMAADERSERVLELTEHIIRMNPAHYTVWLYRAATLKSLAIDPEEELKWLDKIALKHLKNYQIWHHRQLVMSTLSTLPKSELPFLARMLSKDVKNYHVWSYRQWLVRHFHLWPSLEQPGSELEFTKGLLEADVRNNSAWNHRFFSLFGRDKVDEQYAFNANSVPDEVWSQEIEFVKERIRRVPQNQAAWNYLTGILRKKGDGLSTLKEFAAEYADVNNEDQIRSSYALDLLAEIYTQENEITKAEKALKLLSERFDPVRKNYWQYRSNTLSELQGGTDPVSLSGAA